MKFIHLSDTHLLARDDLSRPPHAGDTLRAVIAEINEYHADAAICGTIGRYKQHLKNVVDIIGLSPGVETAAAMNR